jgi:hypothetical protein
LKPLHISPTGEILYHSTQEHSVEVWDLRNGIYLCTCPGSLVGAASDGATLITQTSEGVKAWEARTGLEHEPHSLDPSSYTFHQRFIANANRYKLVVELRDALEIEPPRQVRIEHDPRYYPNLDTWALAPDDCSLIATLSGEVAGQAWASGLCVDLSSGARRFKFKVNKFQRVLPLNFSREHNLLLISDDIYHLALFDLADARAVREVWVSGFTNTAAALVTNPWLVAVSVWEPVASSAVSPFSVQILNLERLPGGRLQRAAVEAVFAEPQAVDDVFFAPDGLHMASLLSNGVIHWWNLATGHVDAIFEAPV